jgi:flagellar motility protein MotE (MotC chaperone)
MRNARLLALIVGILTLVAAEARGADPSGAAESASDAALKALDLEARRQALEILERDITAKLKSLEELRNETEASLKAQKKQQTEDLQTLVKLYEAMKPQSAARLLEELPVDLAAEVLSTMKARGAGKILNVVKPARAVQISRKMAGTKR